MSWSDSLTFCWNPYSLRLRLWVEMCIARIRTIAYGFNIGGNQPSPVNREHSIVKNSAALKFCLAAISLFLVVVSFLRCVRIMHFEVCKFVLEFVDSSVHSLLLYVGGCLFLLRRLSEKERSDEQPQECAEQKPGHFLKHISSLGESFA